MEKMTQKNRVMIKMTRKNRVMGRRRVVMRSRVGWAHAVRAHAVTVA